MTWHGERFEYHGQCDLELATDPDFAGGLGLAVHIRTEIVRSWSYIKVAAIKIGKDILEVQGGADVNHYWINKEYQGTLLTFGGFPIKYHKANSKSHSFMIDLSRGHKIEIRTYKQFVRVNFENPPKELFSNVVGLLGDFTTGKKLARDGVTVLEDVNKYGQEWQVLPSTPQLFHIVSGPQAPLEECILPKKIRSAEKRRRLGAKKVTELEAEAACDMVGVPESERDACVMDVLAVDDLDIAGVY